MTEEAQNQAADLIARAALITEALKAAGRDRDARAVMALCEENRRLRNAITDAMTAIRDGEPRLTYSLLEWAVAIPNERGNQPKC